MDGRIVVFGGRCGEIIEICFILFCRMYIIVFGLYRMVS